MWNHFTPLYGKKKQIMLTAGSTDMASEAAHLGWSCDGEGGVLSGRVPHVILSWEQCLLACRWTSWSVLGTWTRFGERKENTSWRNFQS